MFILKLYSLLCALFCINQTVLAFTAPRSFIIVRSSLGAQEDVAETEDVTSIDPKEVVKVFGRLAEKYIMLDSSGGMCCYSACSDCEYRLPGGGYKMADQSSARPKWIPSYDERSFQASGKEHKTKWSSEIFIDGPAVTKEEFVTRVVAMEFLSPLGGPFISKSSGGIDDFTAIETLFDILSDGKKKLTKHRMGTKIKDLAGGEEGLVWSNFIDCFSS